MLCRYQQAEALINHYAQEVAIDALGKNVRNTLPGIRFDANTRDQEFFDGLDGQIEWNLNAANLALSKQAI